MGQHRWCLSGASSRQAAGGPQEAQEMPGGSGQARAEGPEDSGKKLHPEAQRKSHTGCDGCLEVWATVSTSPGPTSECRALPTVNQTWIWPKHSHLMRREPQRRHLEPTGSSRCPSSLSPVLGVDFLKDPQENPATVILTNVELLVNCLRAWHPDCACVGEGFTPQHPAWLRSTRFVSIRFGVKIYSTCARLPICRMVCCVTSPRSALPMEPLELLVHQNWLEF